jgi:hypothetical protein
MKAVPAPHAPLARPRRAAVIVEDPHIVVVEGTGTADPDAVQGALELLVKWAVRTHQGREQARGEALPIAASADENAGDST